MKYALIAIMLTGLSACADGTRVVDPAVAGPVTRTLCKGSIFRPFVRCGRIGRAAHNVANP